jgi:hypothetical protein
VLIIHGGKDSIVDPRDASLLYAAANGPKELWVEPGADHCGVYFQDRIAYVRKVTEFFDLHLRQARPHLQLVEPSPEQPPFSKDENGNPGLSEAS